MLEREVKKTEDRRVKRTKKALRDCLFQLLDEKTGINSIVAEAATTVVAIGTGRFIEMLGTKGGEDY